MRTQVSGAREGEKEIETVGSGKPLYLSDHLFEEPLLPCLGSNHGVTVLAGPKPLTVAATGYRV